jgi:hypothetical protein
VKSLLSEGEKELHGKHLYPSYLQGEKIGLPITVEPVGSELDKLLRDMIVRAEAYANGKGVAKYLLSRQGGIDVNVQIRKV